MRIILTWFCASLLVDWILQGRLSRFFELGHVFNPNVLVVEKCGGIDCGCHDGDCSCVFLHPRNMTTVVENQRENPSSLRRVERTSEKRCNESFVSTVFCNEKLRNFMQKQF